MSRFLVLTALMMMGSLAGCQQVPPKADDDPVSVSAPVHPVVTGDEPSSEAIRNLQGRVGVLEGQMKTTQPVLKKVDAMEKHFKSLSLELDRISTTYQAGQGDDVTQDSPVTPPPLIVERKPLPAAVVKPVNKEIEKKPAVTARTKASSPTGAGFAVTSVRIGEQQKSVSRIVLDATRPAEIRYDLDNVEKLLVIDIPKAKWSARAAQSFAKSPMVRSFHATSDEGGSRLVLELKQTAKIVSTARLAPNGSSGNRVYIDIAPLR